METRFSWCCCPECFSNTNQTCCWSSPRATCVWPTGYDAMCGQRFVTMANAVSKYHAFKEKIHVLTVSSITFFVFIVPKPRTPQYYGYQWHPFTARASLWRCVTTLFITARKRRCGKVMFLHLSVCSKGRGWFSCMHHRSHDQHPEGSASRKGLHPGRSATMGDGVGQTPPLSQN